MIGTNGKTCRRGLAFAWVTLLLLAGLPAGAAELTVADYVDLTIARLELARTTWSEEGRSPVEAEEATLFESWGTTARAFYQFAGKHAEGMEAFLAENSDKRNRIESLGQEIQSLIEQAEVQP